MQLIDRMIWPREELHIKNHMERASANPAQATHGSKWRLISPQKAMMTRQDPASPFGTDVATIALFTVVSLVLGLARIAWFSLVG